jgi:hypothetical protein
MPVPSQNKLSIFLKHSLLRASIPLAIFTSFIAFMSVAHASPDCTFNGTSRDCTVRIPWYGPGEAVPPGEDVLIIWPDGERTTIKGYGSGWKIGQHVRSNGTTPGAVISVGGKNLAPRILIKSTTGNTFSFTFGD